MNISILLPAISLFHINSVQLIDNRITLEISTIRPTSICPTCQSLSTRIHSHYERNIADLPVAGYQVIFILTIRRFFCDNRDCSRQTFTERLPAIVAHYARKTKRLAELQRRIGFSTGGEVGSRLLRDWQCQPG